MPTDITILNSLLQLFFNSFIFTNKQIDRPYAYLEKSVKDEDVGYKVADFIQGQQKLTNDYLDLCPADLAKILKDRFTAFMIFTNN